MTQQTINAAAENHAQQFNDAQGHQLSFLAGATFAQDGGMRWVKASERLPHNPNSVISRWVDTKKILNDFEYFANKGVILYDIEWLDESESPNINHGGENTL